VPPEEGTAQGDAHQTAVEQLQALLGERGPQGVANQSLAAAGVGGGSPGGGMQGEAELGHAQRSGDAYARLAMQSDGRTLALLGAGRGQAADRGRGELGERGLGLRLVETLGGDEWPYHGISYVRWMSEVALGQFTTGNNAAADNTDRLPVDMHSMMALIVPRGLYIVDNPSISNLDPGPAWVAGNAGKMVFEGLGVGDHMSYQGAGGGHCSWRSQYQASLDAMIDKFLLGNDSASTGTVDTDYYGADPSNSIDWDVPNLTGEL